MYFCFNFYLVYGNDVLLYCGDRQRPGYGDTVSEVVTAKHFDSHEIKEEMFQAYCLRLREIRTNKLKGMLC